mmetsp:Transcript_20465/g.52154  ORF Transcript_20465/g.52154 Transcript_20465/m.52154 type:complete len:200 (+) Transcript_20465:107-706(+)
MLGRAEEVDQALVLRHLVELRLMNGLHLRVLVIDDPGRELDRVAPRLALVHGLRTLGRGVVRSGVVDALVEPVLHEAEEVQLLSERGRRHVLQAQRRVLHAELACLLHVHLGPDGAQDLVVLVEGTLVLEAPINLAPPDAFRIDCVHHHEDDDGKANLKLELRLHVEREDAVEPADRHVLEGVVCLLQPLRQVRVDLRE